MVSDEEGGFLKADPSASWREHLKQFDADAADIEGRAEAAGVPFVAVLVPIRVQVTMISMGKWPARYDPYRLDDQLRSIVAKHGGIYLDILPDYPMPIGVTSRWMDIPMPRDTRPSRICWPRRLPAARCPRFEPILSRSLCWKKEDSHG